MLIDDVAYTIRPSFVMPYMTGMVEDVEKAYGVFKQEAQALKPDYRPETGNTDGWLPTPNAWNSPFPGITLLMCFLHVFISIRDRSSKKSKETFAAVSQKLWNCYRAQTKNSFSQRVRRLCEWSQKAGVPGFMVDKLEKLRKNLPSFSAAYDFPGAFRIRVTITSVMERLGMKFGRVAAMSSDGSTNATRLDYCF